MMCSRYLVGKDGKTTYERRRGRQCRIPVVCFGEYVWYRELSAGPSKNNFETAWKEGVWLGHSRQSNEAIIGVEEGVVRAFAIRRKPDEERWNEIAIRNAKGTPQRPDPKLPGLMIPVSATFDPPETASRESVPIDPWGSKGGDPQESHDHG